MVHKGKSHGSHMHPQAGTAGIRRPSADGTCGCDEASRSYLPGRAKAILLEHFSLEHNAILRRLFEAAPVALVATCARGVVREVNAAGCVMMNATREELLETPLGTYLPGAMSKIMEADRNASGLDPEELWIETQLMPRGAPPRIVEVRLGGPAPETAEESEILLWVLRDVTLRKQRERLQKSRRSQLQELVRARTAELERVNERLLSEVAERKQVEDSLRASEEKFRKFTETIQQVFWMRNSRRFLYISPAYETITGFSRETLYENPHAFADLVHPDDRERFSEAYWLEIEEGIPFDGEFRIIRSDGTMRWAHMRTFPLNSPTDPTRRVGIAEDITARKQTEIFLRVERDLAFQLGSTRSLPEAMEQILDACLAVGCVDSGGIYVVEPETGDLRLICNRGLTPAFVRATSYYARDSLHAQFVRQAQPYYWTRPKNILEMGQILAREGLTALASIPVVVAGEVVAVLNLASHTECNMPQNVRTAIESIATRIASIVSRVRLGEQIETQRRHLEEANAALRALVRQREQDRTELEDSVLENVKQRVLPYVETLRRSGLTEEQKLHLDVLEYHMKEIASPFIRRLSAGFIGLTPTELRVADLIRAGKSSKEMANLLGSSEKAIYFHRQSIREKLDLKNRKINLRSYLASLG